MKFNLGFFVLALLIPSHLVAGLYLAALTDPKTEIKLLFNLSSVAWVGFGILFHELLHILGFTLVSKIKLSNIKPKIFPPRLYINQPIKRSTIFFPLILPFFCLSMVPLVVGIYTQHTGLTLFGAIMMTSCAGDFYLIYKARQFQSSEFLVDDPIAIGWKPVESQS